MGGKRANCRGEGPAWHLWGQSRLPEVGHPRRGDGRTASQEPAPEQGHLAGEEDKSMMRRALVESVG